MTAFLMMEGLTGSVLAFKSELQAFLNPARANFVVVNPRNAPMLDPLDLRQKAMALYPYARIDERARLYFEPGKPAEFDFWPSPHGAVKQEFAVFFNPYTGEKLGEDRGHPTELKEEIIPFIYRLHTSLALPEGAGALGSYLLGVTALIWTIDCFVGFYLTLPLFRASRPGFPSWFLRWKPAWMIKFRASAFRINFDVHRAFGLWTWALLFVLAWSSVGFNLPEVYAPVMSRLFGGSTPSVPAPPPLPQPLDNPKLDLQAAREVGRRLADKRARQYGRTIERDDSLTYNRENGTYFMTAMLAKRSGDSRLDPRFLDLTFDANTGVRLPATLFAGSSSMAMTAADRIACWLSAIHMAAMLGLPVQILICLMGLVITALSVTGVYIWWKKRNIEERSAFRRTWQSRQDLSSALPPLSEADV